MSGYKLKTPKQTQVVVSAYKKIEKIVVETYQKIEDTVVGGYKKIEDRFVETFLETTDEDGSENKLCPPMGNK